MKQTTLLTLAILLIILPIVLAAQQSEEPYFTGEGGKGMRLGILELQSHGLDSGLDYLPNLIQGVLVSMVSKYSAINVLDRKTLDKVILETLDATYEDNLDIVRLGHVAQVGYMMTGTITRTSTGYSLQINVTDTTQRANTIASYSGICTVTQLDDHSAIHRASRELLNGMGVQLTQRAIKELDIVATERQITAQINLAQGNMAQRKGTEVAALSYYFTAAAIDPSLFEAVSRSSVLVADISTGNIGADVRNNIAWRKAWVDRLTETEVFFNNMLSSADPPFNLFYATHLEEGDIDFSKETVELGALVNMRAKARYFNTTIKSIEKVTQAVYDGLMATGQAGTWGLSRWPNEGLTQTNPFNKQWDYPFNVTFELLNDQGRVIGNTTTDLSRFFTISRNNNNQILAKLDTRGSDGAYLIYDRLEDAVFSDVNANLITDNLEIKVVSINRVPAQQAKITIYALSFEQFLSEYYGSGLYFIDHGVLKGFHPNNVKIERDKNYQIAFLNEMWKEPIEDVIKSIGDEAFREKQLTSVSIPRGVTHIGKNAFKGNRIREVSIPRSVVSIAEGAFDMSYSQYDSGVGRNITLNHLTRVTIGDRVRVEYGAFGNAFLNQYYNQYNRKAGTYSNWNWDGNI